MTSKLVIVESPGKIKKITEYLGEGYIVKASFGHCMDLNPKTLSIDVDNNFKPSYVICEGKHKVVKELQALAQTHEVIIASDEDREGEAIGWFLKDILKLDNPKRIVFHEITKKAINEAISKPRELNMNMVWAQQARRLLDRLVGYKISPILWKHMKSDQVQSAGRVQSVVLKIINDKEEDINNMTNHLFLKTVCQLKFKKNKINSILYLNKDFYKFKNIDNATLFLKKFNDKTIFKIIIVDNKKSIKKPSAPFITSTLQQDASTKLRFGVQKTMQIAQKLYEEGHITYMRTDSTLLSKDAIESCKKHIINTWGEKYSNPKQYNTTNNNAQEAHEAIRPTNINLSTINTSDKNCVKLYELIWKRMMASQMTPAEINIQTIKIDSINNNISILPDKTLWVSVFESIIFEGYLILYNNIETSDESDEKQTKDIEFKIDDILNLEFIKITEEYTKLPLRFNEANLVKYLETNNIGRPSTYASIINKIIERNYVEVKNIEGIKKESKEIKLNNKYEINEKTNEISIGNEKNKIVPTNIGIEVNKFMITNFSDIIQIDFTVEFEKYLDMIAIGEAKWFNILDKFYKMFNPIVENLTKILNNNNDKLLGLHPITKGEIFIGCGNYGNYIKYNNKYTSINDTNIELDNAIILLDYPKNLGKYDNKQIELCVGKFGYYIKYNNKNYSFNQNDINIVNVEYFKNLIESKDKYALKTFKIKDTIVNVKNGQYGPFLQLLNSKNKVIKNIPIPNKININDINIDIVINLIKK